MASRLFRSVSSKLPAVRQYASSAAEHEAHLKSTKLWKMATIFAVPPALAATYYHAYYVEDHHHRPEYIEYEHLRIRTKPFPWGDGNHTLFHNPEMNAVPGVGYEEEAPHH